MRLNFFNLFAAIAGLGVVTSGLAQTKSPEAADSASAANASGPKIAFDSLVYDFGKISANELVKHSFVFTNLGKSTLEILDVRPGCGCTTAGSWDKKVEPGKTGSIPLQFNSAGFGGGVTKQATVTCNDPANSNLVLQIRGLIWKPIDVTPTMAFFNLSSEAQTNDTKVVRIVNQLEQPLILSDLQLSNSSFKAELKTIKPGKEFELHVTAIPPFTNSPVMAPITLKTSSTNMPTINVSAYAVVQQAVTVTPSQLTLQPGPLTAPMSMSIGIRNSGTNTLVLSEPKVNAPGVDVRIQEGVPGRVFSLVVNLPTGFAIKPEQKIELTVKSNHPKHPLIVVPIYQMQPPTAVPTAQSTSAQVGPAK
jgi:hypothetical protein